eukprot:COSAG04_NODE_272_length_18495_cov_17.526256_7_plen_156_part_00
MIEGICRVPPERTRLLLEEVAARKSGVRAQEAEHLLAARLRSVGGKGRARGRELGVDHARHRVGARNRARQIHDLAQHLQVVALRVGEEIWIDERRVEDVGRRKLHAAERTRVEYRRHEDKPRTPGAGRDCAQPPSDRETSQRRCVGWWWWWWCW